MCHFGRDVVWPRFFKAVASMGIALSAADPCTRYNALTIPRHVVRRVIERGTGDLDDTIRTSKATDHHQ
jgi:hypothetical protein